VEEQLRRGHPDVEGLCLALMDWSAELRLIEAERSPEGDRIEGLSAGPSGGKAM
jgi:hypothetical protein